MARKPSRNAPSGNARSGNAPSHGGKSARHDAASADASAPGSRPAADDGAEGAEDVPMNRAERRAKGKGAAQPRPIGKIVPGRTNLVHGPRSYANRRSGG